MEFLNGNVDFFEHESNALTSRKRDEFTTNQNSVLAILKFKPCIHYLKQNLCSKLKKCYRWFSNNIMFAQNINILKIFMPIKWNIVDIDLER
jgi:hypothetical protein